MKPRFVDPFTPNRPIDDPERFIGREDQINELVDSLFQTLNNNPKHTIVTGDRGIGKSSLLVQIEKTASGDNALSDRHKIDKGVPNFSFSTVWHNVAHDQGPEELSSSILNKLEGKFSALIKKFKIELNVSGFIKIAKEERGNYTISDLVDNFIDRIRQISESLVKEKRNGLLIFIDELDRIKTGSGISTFFKLSTEKLAREGITNVAFVCGGITGAIQSLEEEHASILRTFRDIPLPRFNLEETKSILETGFKKAEREYKEDVITRAFEVSTGLPEPIHILGSELLSVDKDGVIDIQDFEAAIKKIVTDVRKNKLSSLLKIAGTGKYQKILEAMSKYEKKYVPLDFIAKYIEQDQSQFSANMGTLIQREIISKPVTGVYTFVDPLLKEYINTFGILTFDSE